MDVTYRLTNTEPVTNIELLSLLKIKKPTENKKHHVQQQELLESEVSLMSKYRTC